MDPHPNSPDVVLDISLDDHLVRTVHLDSAVIAPAAADAEPLHDPGDRLAVTLPRDGRLRLALDLRTPPPDDGRPAPVYSMTVSYDLDGRPWTDSLRTVTTFVYERPDRTVRLVADEPPDEPHISR
jgi:hypothetical protein